MSKPNGGPAFPACDTIASDGMLVSKSMPGMSLRDYLAAKAMPQLMTSLEEFSRVEVRDMALAAGVSGSYELVARRAYEQADAMIAESARET